VIVKQGIEINRNQGSKLAVEITDQAMKMTLSRKNAIYEDIKDSDLIGKLISDNGLEKSVAPTNTVYETIVQYYASDWDLMLTRAQLNGFVVIADGGKVTVGEPKTDQPPSLKVVYGESILDLEADMDAATQFAPSAIKSTTWNEADQELGESGPGSVNVKEQGNLSSEELAKVFDVKTFIQQTGATLEESSLQDWSSAELLKSMLSKIRGRVRFHGSALAQTGKTIELGGLGERFNGIAFISGVHHNISSGAWLTTVTFGLNWPWFTDEAPNIAAPAASGQLPPIQGLQTGKVKQVAEDPAGEFRVLVNLPILGGGSKGVWARLGTFYGSNEVGAVFFPEVDDEVIVAFMNQDPRNPVILGSVYSKKLPPAYPPDEDNNTKAIVTRSEIQIVFNDEDIILEIKTPEQEITIDDKAGSITIKDNNKNSISLSSSGITLESDSDITLTAKGDINISTNANLALSAKQDVSVEGMQVEHKAKTKFAADGGAGAEVTSNAMLTLRGNLVKIN
jgi:Rhs element Vgr protein